MKLSKNFDSIEFDSPDKPGSGTNMNRNFINKLQCARDIAKMPFKINSGYRTIEHNKAVGGVQNSAHIKGLACDINIADNHNRYLIVNSLLSVQFSRIGIGKHFVHVDNDDTKPTRVIWLYNH